MTYNVFGGTLNLSQLQLARTSVAQTEQAVQRLMDILSNARKFTVTYESRTKCPLDVILPGQNAT